MLIWEDLTKLEKLAIKELSTHDFDTFVKIWFPIQQGEKWIPNWHHLYIARAIDEIIEGVRKDTIFNVTPGSGKTELLSIHFPPYSYLKLNKVRNLNISFADTLVKRNSKRVRDLVNSREWQELYPAKTGTSKDDEFQILNDAGKVRLEMISKSMGGQITGSRGGYITPGVYSGCVTLDDPEKPDDMFSKVKRERGQMIAKNTIRSRRAHSETPVIVIQQRLHAQDMTWFLMNGGMGIEFDQISIPAMVTEEYGKSLPDWLQPHFEKDVLSSEYIVIDGVKYYSFWPSKESIHDLKALRDADLYTFLSQYQQEPIALGGNAINVGWFQYYGTGEKSTMPKPDRFDYTFITADTAQKEGELNDYSVLCYWGMFKGRIYFIDGVRGKWEAPMLETQFKAFVKQCWNRNKECGNLRKIYVEDKASGTGLIQNCRKAFPIEITPVQRDKDKVTRCMDAQPVIKNGYVVLPESHHMLAEFLAEAAAFTYDDSHPHDDIMDNLFDAVNIELNLADNAVDRMKRLAGLAKR